MIRAGLAANAATVALFATPTSGIKLVTRATAAATATTVNGPANGAPYWLKLVRAGGTFTAYASPDGVAWSPVGSSVSVAMTGTVYIGLASCSRVSTLLNTATFTDVAVSNAAPTIATAPAATPNPLLNRINANLHVLGADDHGEANLTYTWSASRLPNDDMPIPFFSNNGTNAAKNTIVSFFGPGDYQLLVTITDSAGLSTTATLNVSVYLPPVITSVNFDYRRAISVTFDSDVSASLTTTALAVYTQPTGPAFTPTRVSWDGDTKTATFTFDTPFPDGNYRAVLRAIQVFTPVGLHPDADYPYDFYAFAGDLNGDRVVDFADMRILAQSYNTSGKSYFDGDLTGDGVVDFNDLVVLAQHYNTSLNPPPSPAPALARTAAAAARSPFNVVQSIRLNPPKPVTKKPTRR
jgi:hypothetical protein